VLPRCSEQGDDACARLSFITTVRRRCYATRRYQTRSHVPARSASAFTPPPSTACSMSVCAPARKPRAGPSCRSFRASTARAWWTHWGATSSDGEEECGWRQQASCRSNLGSLGIQIAKKIIGAKVIAAAGSATRVQMGVALGADHGVNYNTCALAAELNKLTGGKGVDVLYDNIANPKVLPTAFRSIGLDGRLVTAGAHAGPNVSIDFAHLYHNRITIKGRPGYHAPDVAKCFAAAAEGKIKPHIAGVLPLSQAPEAHRMMEAGEEQGKIVLDPTLG
jgi:Zn-dependent alcohol dehydrogenase